MSTLSVWVQLCLQSPASQDTKQAALAACVLLVDTSFNRCKRKIVCSGDGQFRW